VESPKCGECGHEMELRTTYKYTYPNGDPRKFWGCLNYPRCRGTHGAHPDGTPFGVPANKETKIARTQAHNAFDRYWCTKGWTRGEAYKWLEQAMGLEKGQAHIGGFNAEQCTKLVSIVEELEKEPGYLSS